VVVKVVNGIVVDIVVVVEANEIPVNVIIKV
jgi:hypothetical protein